MKIEEEILEQSIREKTKQLEDLTQRSHKIQSDQTSVRTADTSTGGFGFVPDPNNKDTNLAV